MQIRYMFTPAWGLSQRYTYRVLQTIQMKLILLCVWAEPAVLGSIKTAVKIKYEIKIGKLWFGGGQKMPKKLNLWKAPLKLGGPQEYFRCITSLDNSMTSLLTHTVAHSTRPSFRLKTNNQLLKKFLSLAVTWVKVVKNGQILTFKVNFLRQKLSDSF